MSDSQNTGGKSVSDDGVKPKMSVAETRAMLKSLRNDMKEAIDARNHNGLQQQLSAYELDKAHRSALFNGNKEALGGVENTGSDTVKPATVFTAQGSLDFGNENQHFSDEKTENRTFIGVDEIQEARERASNSAKVERFVDGKVELVRFKGVITHIRHRDDAENFAIFSIKPFNSELANEKISVKGFGLNITKGSDVEVAGEWSEHPKHGLQIKNAIVSDYLPRTHKGVYKALMSGFARGIDADLAGSLVTAFGGKLFDIAVHNPNILLTVPGMNVKRLSSLVDSVKEKQLIPNIMNFMTQIGIKPHFSQKVYKKFGDSSIEVIKENPYALTEIPAIGFKLADTVALNLGMKPDSEVRVQAAMEAILIHQGNLGSTAVPFGKLVNDIMRLFNTRDAEKGIHSNVQKSRVRDVVLNCISRDSNVVVREMPMDGTDDYQMFISLRHHYEDELSIAQGIRRLIQTCRMGDSNLDPSSPRYAHLDNSQREAVQVCTENPVSIITGGPGCGKTTVTKSVISALEESGLRVMLIAPTGMAAKRASSATERPASTVHRALKSKGEEGFVHCRSNPLDADVVICDEFSMMDASLTASLIKAIGNGTRLVMVGDVDQLASVMAGRVLYDLIESGMVATARLTEPHRAAKDSTINQNAFRVNRGEVPLAPAPGKNDFLMFDINEKDQKIDKILELYKGFRRQGIEPDQIQILTPMRKVVDRMGSTSMNNILKEFINPASYLKEKDTIKKMFDGVEIYMSVGDRVMQMSNNKELDIFNGDVGTIKAMDHENRLITIQFGDDFVDVPMSEVQDLDLAFATTIHKSQGSEYKAVIIILDEDHTRMLDRNLLYTAMTRGKKTVAMVGDMEMLKNVVIRSNSSMRTTGLRGELIKFLEEFQMKNNASMKMKMH